MRPVKLDSYDHPFTCPICKANIVYTCMHTVITNSRRACPSCKGEVLIEQGVARAISDKKPPKREAPPSAKRSRK